MEMSPSYDVIIVGAGPAGCMAAKFLTPDLSVLLIDKSTLSREKTCGGLLSDESLAFFHSHSITPPSEIFRTPVPTDFVVMDWNSNKEYHFDPNFANISRQAFDKWLVGLVPEEVQIEAETKLTDIIKQEETVEVQLQQKGRSLRVKTQYLIGADGAMSLTRRLAFDSVPPARAYVTVQEWILPKEKIDCFVGIYDKTLTPYFCWLISKEEMLILGGGFTKKESTLKKLEKFKALLKDKLSLFGETVKREGDIILSPSSMREVCIGGGRVLLAGEAAGLISSSSGEGISFALRSGFFCAEAINTERKEAFLHYSHLLKPLLSSMRRKIIKARLLSQPFSRRLLRFAAYRKRDVLIERGSVCF